MTLLLATVTESDILVTADGLSCATGLRDAPGRATLQKIFPVPSQAVAIGQCDAQFPEFFAFLLGVALASRGNAFLPVLDFSGDLLNQCRRRAAVKPPRAYQCADGRVDLAHGQVRFFSPATFDELGPGTSSSRR